MGVAASRFGCLRIGRIVEHLFAAYELVLYALGDGCLLSFRAPVLGKAGVNPARPYFGLALTLAQ